MHDVPLARRLRALLLIENGFTVDHRTGRPLADGLAVGTEPTRTLTFPQGRWSEDEVVGWLRATRAAVAAGPADGRHLGGWREGGRVWLDVVRVVPAGGEHRARALARTYGQRALYDLGHRALVPVDGA